MVHFWLLSWSVWITISLELAVDNVPMIARGGGGGGAGFHRTLAQ